MAGVAGVAGGALDFVLPWGDVELGAALVAVVCVGAWAGGGLVGGGGVAGEGLVDMADVCEEFAVVGGVVCGPLVVVGEPVGLVVDVVGGWGLVELGGPLVGPVGEGGLGGDVAGLVGGLGGGEGLGSVGCGEVVVVDVDGVGGLAGAGDGGEVLVGVGGVPGLVPHGPDFVEPSVDGVGWGHGPAFLVGGMIVLMVWVLWLLRWVGRKVRIAGRGCRGVGIG